MTEEEWLAVANPLTKSLLSLAEVQLGDIASESRTLGLGALSMHFLRHKPTGASGDVRLRDGELPNASHHEEMLCHLAVGVLSQTMTESKWWRCPDARPMLRFLEGYPRRRKLRLFACAMAQPSLHLLVGLDGERLLREAEEAADEGGNETTIRLPIEILRNYAANHSINSRGREAQRGEVEASHLLQTCRDTVAPLSQTEWHAAWHNAMGASRPFTWANADAKEGGPEQQVAALVDIFGPLPFRPVSFAPPWRTEHTVGIASKMYEDRDFAPMPILADALQEAGCEDESILSHCREPGGHVRGCWVVDLVLGKE